MTREKLYMALGAAFTVAVVEGFVYDIHLLSAIAVLPAMVFTLLYFRCKR